jgi:hypothetical protein
MYYVCEFRYSRGLVAWTDALDVRRIVGGFSTLVGDNFWRLDFINIHIVE